MVNPQLQRTQLSMKGVGLTARFDATLIHDRVSGYTPRLVEPAGESTGGGKQATQHIVLEPPNEALPLLTVGWVNCANNNVKLRSHSCMAQLIDRRFPDRKLSLDAAAYQVFFDKAVSFLTANGMQVSTEERPPELAKAAAAGTTARPAGDAPWKWVVLGVLLIAAGVLLWLVLLGR